MDLKTFISQSLIEIADGTKDAADYLKKENPSIIIGAVSARNDRTQYIAKTGKHYNVRDCKFNVAVTIEESEKKNAGGGAKLAVFNANADMNTENQISKVNSITFEVPIAFESIEE